MLNIWFVNIFCGYTQLKDRTVLFLAIQFSIIQLLTVPLLQFITRNSIKPKSIVLTQLNDQTVLYQTIQFRINYLFALRFNVKQFCLNPR